MDFAEGMNVTVSFEGEITDIERDSYYSDSGEIDNIIVEDKNGGSHTIDMTADQSIVQRVKVPLIAGDLLKGNDGLVYVGRANQSEGPEATHVYGVTNTMGIGSTNTDVATWLASNKNFELLYRLPNGTIKTK